MKGDRNCFLKPTIAIITRKEPGQPGSIGGTLMLVDERARSLVDRATGPRPARAPHPADSNRSSIWTGELEPAIGLKARNAWSVAIALGRRVSEC
jgi:hypothetical protein